MTSCERIYVVVGILLGIPIPPRLRLRCPPEQAPRHSTPALGPYRQMAIAGPV